jgi:hypothetical protein
MIPDEGVVAVRLARTCGTLENEYPDTFADLERNIEDVFNACDNRQEILPFDEMEERPKETQMYPQWETLNITPKKKRIYKVL